MTKARATMKTLLIMLFCGFSFVLCPSLAQAQNKIIVIKRDGSSEQIDLPKDQPLPETQEILKRAEELKQQKTKAVPVPQEQELSVEELMREAPIEKQKPVVQEKSVPKEITTKKSVEKPVVKSKPVKTSAPKKEIKQKAQKKNEVKKIVPVPPPKPSAEEIERAINAKPLINHIDPANIPPGTVITRDLAVRAALEVAPASRGFEVFSTTYEGRPAFQVQFKTDGGPHDVIVDAETGKVLFK